ncbi:MAG: hypothetical protein WBG37_05575 [Desulfobacterales bacterium]|jgi:hypothetical protein
MAKKVTGNGAQEHRSEPRTLLEKYHTVQFTLNRAGPAYMFKLWDLSAQGLCILVRRDSAVLKVLKVGDIMDMQFLPPGARVPAEQLRTEIRHITAKDEESPASGHSMVGLLILERQPADA